MPSDLSSQISRESWHDEALKRASNAMASVLMECCTVEECENLAEINPADWLRMAERAIDEYNCASVEIASRDLRRVRARARARIVSYQPCNRLLVGRGTDTYDPLCALPEGHSGRCLTEEEARAA